MYSIDFERYETIILGRCRGDFTLSSAVSLRKELEQVLKTSKVKDLALDLSSVGKVDSSGLGALVGACTTARARGKRLMLYMPSPRVQLILEQADIIGFFPLLDDENDLKARLLKRL